jgi:hypothetical protein
MSVWTYYLRLIGATIIALVMGGPASAQTKLKWAHVYEVTEPYHTEALWAASEIRKRTNGRFDITVFPASQLGNENQLNEALGLSAVDIVYVGINFVAATYQPLGITGAPFMLRDLDHWKAYRDSKLFSDLVQGYDEKTRHKIVALTYYGQRHVTANKPIRKPEDMKGMRLRVPPAPLFLMFTKSVGADATPIAFSDVYVALQQGLGRRPGKSTADDHGQEILRGAEPHRADRPHHRVDGDGDRQSCLEQADAGRPKDFCGYVEGSRLKGDRGDRGIREDFGRGVQEARQDRDRARSRGVPKGGDPAAQ